MLKKPLSSFFRAAEKPRTLQSLKYEFIGMLSEARTREEIEQAGAFYFESGLATRLTDTHSFGKLEKIYNNKREAFHQSEYDRAFRDIGGSRPDLKVSERIKKASMNVPIVKTLEAVRVSMQRDQALTAQTAAERKAARPSLFVRILDTVAP